MKNQENKSNIHSFYKHSSVSDKYSIQLNNSEISNENIITDYDSLSHLRVMKKFNSPIVQAPQNIMKKWEMDEQNTFFIRFYLPKKKISHVKREQRINHLIIMFNGLDEFLNYDLYDVLGAQFAEQGFASVLLPTPYHLNRRILKKVEDGKNYYFQPTEIAKGKYSLMYYFNFKKSLLELEHLISCVNGTFSTDQEFYSTYFAEKPKITLFGYSLGGLRALASFLKFKNLHSCFTFNTGPDLTKAEVKNINADPSSWKRTMNVLKETFKENYPTNLRLPKTKQIYYTGENQELTKLFKWLYLGKKDSELTTLLKNHSNFCLSIQSGGDSAVQVASHDHISDPAHGLHRLIVAGVNHNPAKDIKWENWLSQVGTNIIHFLKGCDEQHYTRLRLEQEIKEIIAKTNYYKRMAKLTPSDIELLEFKFEDFDKLKNEIKNNKNDSDAEENASKFVTLYYISKAFYPKFPELIAKIIKASAKPSNV